LGLGFENVFMVSYDRVFVPTDGSELAEVAVDHAIEIADKFEAEVHVLYVVDIRASTPGAVWQNMMGEFHEIGENATTEIAEKMEKKGLDKFTEVTEGVPHREINNYAEEESLDLIVMRTHGRTGLDRVLVGSNTEKIVRTSEIPVMTVGRSE